MGRSILLLGVLAAGGILWAGDDDVTTFRSDVSLVRVDVQVLDRSNRAVPRLRREDFTLRESGKTREIRNFANEDMPVDVLLLLDVSGSMRPHVERIASASRQALSVLGPEDRVAIMVFDRRTRVRMPFRGEQEQIIGGLRELLDQEGFNGGTDITSAFYSAIKWISKNARKEARRAIVILTDDQTEFNRDDAGVILALSKADTVLSALIAPDAMGHMGRYPGGGGGGGGRGTTMGDILGGIILGGRIPSGGGSRYPGGGGGYPGGGGMGGSRTSSAGTSEIAETSGGDSMSVGNASAFEDTLNRIRQRYALYFSVPPGAMAGQERQIEVSLAGNTRRRYADADVRYRRTYYAPMSTPGAAETDTEAETVSITEAREAESGRTKTTTSSASTSSSTQASGNDESPRLRRRPAVDGSSGSRGPNPSVGAGATTTSTATSEPTTSTPSATTTTTAKKPGWRSVDEPEPATTTSTAPAPKKQ